MTAVLSPFATSGGSGTFGDASDGAATLDGVATVPWATLAANVYTMTRDCFCSSLTVNAGVTLKPATAGQSQRIFVQGTLSGAGIISSNGLPAAGATGGAALGSGTNGGSGAGATGVATAAPGAAGSAVPGAGGGGGNGGASGANAGGTGGAVNQNVAIQNALHTPAPVLGGSLGIGGSQRQLSSGGGGGAGAGDGTSAGGGGGGGAGIVPIFARSITGTLTFQAIGGAAGAGAGTNAGGGGGGGGGLIWTGSQAAIPGTITQTVTGGALGAGSGTGSAGNAGVAGVIINVLLN